MAWQQNNSGSSGGCFGRRRRDRVRPFSPNPGSSDIVEIRPKRFLHIQHINPRPRDTRFEKEMNMQRLYKSQGLQAGVVSAGPLSMPKSIMRGLPVRKSSQASTPLPNSVDPGGMGDSSKREISASGSKAEFASPSAVEVAVHSTTVTESGVPVPDSVPASATTHADVETLRTSDNKNTSNSFTNHSTDMKATLASEDESALSDSELAELSISAADTTSPGKTFTSKLEDQTPECTPKRNGFVPLSPRRPTTVLFFIHGVGGSSNVWQAQMKHFAKQGYEIVVPDLIGHGLSCTPKDAKSYHFLEIASDMEEIFDKYCKKRNVVIGHSYGCSFAVVLARRRSRRVQKLVLISGGSPTPLAPQPGIFTLPTCMLGCFRPCLNCGFHKSAFHTTRQPVVDKEEAFSIPTYVLQHTMNGQDWADGDELYHQWLLCPTLLIYGAQDKLVSLKEEEHMEETIFRSRLEVIPDASHMVMIEAPEDVNRLLDGFLTEDSTLCTKSNSPQPPAQPARPPTPQQEVRPYSRMSLKSAKSTKSHKAMPSRLL